MNKKFAALFGIAYIAIALIGKMCDMPFEKNALNLIIGQLWIMTFFILREINNNHK